MLTISKYGKNSKRDARKGNRFHIIVMDANGNEIDLPEVEGFYWLIAIL